jgi:glucosamine--fructose-6-phosphate aminotransferase (isomerizing)
MWVVPDKFSGCVTVHENQSVRLRGSDGTDCTFDQLTLVPVPGHFGSVRSRSELCTFSEIQEQTVTIQQLPEVPACIKEILARTPHLIFVACGSSKYAAMVARYFFAGTGVAMVTVEDASEFDGTFLFTDAAYILVSQSGETLDVLRVLNILESKKLPAFAITNTPGSQLSRRVPCIHLLSGREVGVAATKSFTAQVMAIGCMAAYAGATVPRVTLSPAQSQALQKLARSHAAQFVSLSSTFFLGSQEFYPLACEAALKFKELTYIHAEAFPTGSLKHGPLALITDGTVVVVMLTRKNHQRAVNVCSEILARGATLIVVSDTRSVPASLPHGKITVVECGESDSDLQSIMNFLVFFQYLAFYVSVGKGINPDRPRNLAKTVTVL